MRVAPNTDSLEARIQYKFNNPALMQEALMHPSLRVDKSNPSIDNQRLEFLGDAVLQLVLSEYLFHHQAGWDEGMMTKLRTGLVSEKGLIKMGQKIDLARHIQVGRSITGFRSRERESMLADAMEALIGAIYLDGSLESARTFILRLAEVDIKLTMASPTSINPKGELQELLQETMGDGPVYELLSEVGPPHEKIFTSRVLCQETELGQGSGTSKKEAEAGAARQALASVVLKELLRRKRK